MAPRIFAASSLPAAPPLTRFGIDSIKGQLTELSSLGAGAGLTLAMKLVLEAQLSGEPAAWLTGARTCFYPPDAAAMGVDLTGLVIVRVNSTLDLWRAADQLLRSGAFGLVVVDMEAGGQMPAAAQARLLGLVHKHDAALLCLTHKSPQAPSLGALCGLRLHSERERLGDNLFACRVSVLRSKRGAQGFTLDGTYHGPVGMR